jgi:hypothetical protein
VRNVSFALAAALLPFAGTYLYFWIWQDYYFPDRYEDALRALAVAAVVSVVALVAMTAFHLASYVAARRGAGK